MYPQVRFYRPQPDFHATSICIAGKTRGAATAIIEFSELCSSTTRAFVGNKFLFLQPFHLADTTLRVLIIHLSDDDVPLWFPVPLRIVI